MCDGKTVFVGMSFGPAKWLISWVILDVKKAEAILGVPEGYAVVEITPLGYPDGASRTPARKELAEIFFNDKFGAEYETP